MNSKTIQAAMKRAQANEKVNTPTRNDMVENAKQDFRETFATPHGRRALRIIMEACGYQKRSTVMDPTTGDALVNGTIHNEARRSVYIGLRELLDRETLIAVEIDKDEPTNPI